MSASEKALEERINGDVWSTRYAELHKERASRMLHSEKGTELRKLFGHSYPTLLMNLACVVITWTCALYSPYFSILTNIGIIFFIGAPVSLVQHFLGHEYGHRLVFRSVGANALGLILNDATRGGVDIGRPLSGLKHWFALHHVHHSEFGGEKDLTTKRHRKLFLPYAHFKFRWMIEDLIWLPYDYLKRVFMFHIDVLYALVTNQHNFLPFAGRQMFLEHKGEDYFPTPFEKETVQNRFKVRRLWPYVYIEVAVLLIMVYLIPILFGYRVMLYLLYWNAVRLWNPWTLGVIMSNLHIQKKYICSQPDWWSPLMLNTGYHAEHHDFEQIPWSKLPRLRELFPEEYSEKDLNQRGFVSAMNWWLCQDDCPVA